MTSRLTLKVKVKGQGHQIKNTQKITRKKYVVIVYVEYVTKVRTCLGKCRITLIFKTYSTWKGYLDID